MQTKEIAYMKSVRTLSCALLLCGFASLLGAQGVQTGTIRGVVRDAQGLAVPGATVTVTSAALQGPRAGTTDATGGYVFPNLPPGTYNVKVELSGFQTVDRPTTVPLGLVVEQNVTLNTAGVAETVQVVAEAPSWYHPGRSGTIQMGPQNKLATFGEIHPRILSDMDVKGPLVAFEVNLTVVPESRSKIATRAALKASDLMAVKRDFAFVVEDGVEAEKVVKAAKSADKQLISDVTVFDRFAGGTLEAGKASLAIEVTIQPREKTLTEEEIEELSKKVVAQVHKATGGVLRT